mmetsp:Transcript_59492/g.94656  ORF Transcript_59492/g.94656 Transcript_59492/m.94656 type:complete len:236 (-) Transcript_59492:529-1236(-)
MFVHVTYVVVRVYSRLESFRISLLGILQWLYFRLFNGTDIQTYILCLVLNILHWRRLRLWQRTINRQFFIIIIKRRQNSHRRANQVQNIEVITKQQVASKTDHNHRNSRRKPFNNHIRVLNRHRDQQPTARPNRNQQHSHRRDAGKRSIRLRHPRAVNQHRHESRQDAVKRELDISVPNRQLRLIVPRRARRHRLVLQQQFRHHAGKPRQTDNGHNSHCAFYWVVFVGQRAFVLQ